MKNAEYWKRRFETLEKAAISKGEEYLEALEREYKKVMRTIESEIARWYQRFAVNNNISLSDAKKWLSVGELKEFQWSVWEYIEYGKKNAVSELWVRQLENASARVHISRLEALQLDIQQQIEVLYGNRLDGVDNLARRIYADTYYHTAFEVQKGFNIGWDLTPINKRQLGRVISNPWTLTKENFSDRLWTQKTALIAKVHTELSQMILRGDSPDKAIKAIAHQFHVSKNQAGRLVMTESAYFASEAQKDCFNALDVERYQILATLDSHTSELCQSLDGHILEMKNYVAGVTAPPFHPWCRTTTIPYFEDDYGERAARGADGKTYYVPSNMTYEKWKKTFVAEMSANAETIQWPIRNAANVLSNVEYKELRDYANERDIRLERFRNSDVDVELAREMIDTASDMLNTFPELKGDGLHSFTIRLAGLHANDFALVSKNEPFVLQLNEAAMRNKALLSTEYQKLVQSGWFVGGTDYKSIIYHEMGHIYENIHKINGLTVVSTIAKTDSFDGVSKILNSKLSEYGSVDPAEILSEMFSAYFSGIKNDLILTFFKMVGILK